MEHKLKPQWDITTSQIKKADCSKCGWRCRATELSYTLGGVQIGTL